MIPIPPFSSSSDNGYFFSRGLIIGNVFIGRDTIIYVNGGVPPYTWSVTGTAFSLMATTTTDQFNKIFSNENTIAGESTEEITVVDAEGSSIDFIIQCCARYTCCEQSGNQIDCELYLEMPSGDSVWVDVYEGCPPFEWWTEDNSLLYFATKYTNTRKNKLIFPDYASANYKHKSFYIKDSCDDIASGSIGFPFGYLFSVGSNNYNKAGLVGASASLLTAIESERTFKKVACGKRHTLAIDSDGNLWAWGYNNAGQLGTGDSVNRAYPTLIDMSGNWVDVAVGYYFSIAVNSLGAVYTTGSDIPWGSLGLNNTGNRDEFTWVYVPGFVVQCAAGLYHAVVITTGGSVYAWGNNEEGQIDQGSITPDRYYTPEHCTTLSTVEYIACGPYNTFAIESVGKDLYVCGQNDGSFGYGNPPYRYLNFTKINAAYNWKTVSTNEYHTVGVSYDGKLLGGGKNYKYVLPGATSNPMPFFELLSGYYWVDAKAGEVSTIGLTIDGKIFASGENVYGEIGQGYTSSYVTELTQITTCVRAGHSVTLGEVEFIAAGSFYHIIGEAL